MKHYIDKDALIAEIERRIGHNTEWKDGCKTLAVLAANEAIVEDKKILSIINTLEVKEVDLENEIDKVWDTDYEDFGISADDFYRLAKYFFELGLKAQKGE